MAERVIGATSALEGRGVNGRWPDGSGLNRGAIGADIAKWRDRNWTRGPVRVSWQAADQADS